MNIQQKCWEELMVHVVDKYKRIVDNDFQNKSSVISRVVNI